MEVSAKRPRPLAGAVGGREPPFCLNAYTIRHALNTLPSTA